MDQKQRFVDGPRDTFVKEAVASATDVPRPVASGEGVWEKAHPEGRVLIGAQSLVLWNFAVGDASLKPQHETALKAFAERVKLSVIGGGVVLVDGHASATGEEARNLHLSRERAHIVAWFLMRSGIAGSAVKASGSGERRPLGAGDSGEALARDRRVEVTVLVPARKEPVGTTSTTEPAPPTAVEGDDQVLPSSAPRGFGVVFQHRFEEFLLKKPLGLPCDVAVSGEVKWFKSSFVSDKNVIVAEIRTGQLQVALESWIKDNLRFKATQDRLAVGWRYERAIVEVETDTDPRMPFTLAVTILPTDELATINVDGIIVKIVEAKLRLRFIPNEKLLRLLRGTASRLASRMAPWLLRASPAFGAGSGVLTGVFLGVSIAYLGWIWWGMSELEAARERGRQQGLLYHARQGYAHFIHCAVTEMDEEHERRDKIDGISNLLGDRDAALLGWEIAKIGWREIDSDEKREELKEFLGARRHVRSNAIYRRVFEGIGGTRRGGTLPRPEELPQILRNNSVNQ